MMPAAHTSGSIPATHPLRRIFHDLVRECFKDTLPKGDAELATYVADMLTDFSSTERLYPVFDREGKPVRGHRRAAAGVGSGAWNGGVVRRGTAFTQAHRGLSAVFSRDGAGERGTAGAGGGDGARRAGELLGGVAVQPVRV